MARLKGAQRMVLQAINDLPADPAGFISDLQIAQRTHLDIGDVRDWIETLDGDGYVEVARATDGLRTLITAEGRLALGQFSPLQESGSSIASVLHAQFLSMKMGSCTGDQTIDEFYKTLERIQSDAPDFEIQLWHALDTLFQRQAFYPHREEGNWKEFLYIVWKTRKIIEQIRPMFRSEEAKNVMRNINELLGELKQLATHGIFKEPHFIDGSLYRSLDNKAIFVSSCPTEKAFNGSSNRARQAIARKIYETYSSFKPFGD